MEEAALKIYIAAAMHRIRPSKLVDLIIAEKMPAHGMGDAINDKLERAASR